MPKRQNVETKRLPLAAPVSARARQCAASDPIGSPAKRHGAVDGLPRDLLEPQIEVGSPAVDPDLPLYGGLIFVAAQLAIPWGSSGSSKYAHSKEQPEGIRRRTVGSVTPFFDGAA
jgi:hypothetical protein